MNVKRKVTLDDVLREFNPYHGSKDRDGFNGALGVNSEKRKIFTDLLMNVMDPEHEDVREWDKSRWESLVSFTRF